MVGRRSALASSPVKPAPGAGHDVAVVAARYGVVDHRVDVHRHPRAARAQAEALATRFDDDVLPHA